jgi:hypothetical protein
MSATKIQKIQILSTCPAAEWCVIYRDPDDGHLFAERLAVWAVVRDVDGDRVHGLQMGGVGQTYGPDDANEDQFVCYLHERDLGSIPFAAPGSELDFGGEVQP